MSNNNNLRYAQQQFQQYYENPPQGNGNSIVTPNSNKPRVYLVSRSVSSDAEPIMSQINPNSLPKVSKKKKSKNTGKSQENSDEKAKQSVVKEKQKMKADTIKQTNDREPNGYNISLNSSPKKPKQKNNNQQRMPSLSDSRSTELSPMKNRSSSVKKPQPIVLPFLKDKQMRNQSKIEEQQYRQGEPVKPLEGVLDNSILLEQNENLQEEYNFSVKEIEQTKAKISHLENSIQFLQRRLDQIKPKNNSSPKQSSSPQPNFQKQQASQNVQNNKSLQVNQSIQNKYKGNVDQKKGKFDNQEKQTPITQEQQEMEKNREQVNQELAEVSQFLQQTDLKKLEQDRFKIFDQVVQMRQTLDKTLLSTKLATLKQENKEGQMGKVYDERLKILEEDKNNLQSQHQKLSQYNEGWKKKIKRAEEKLQQDYGKKKESNSQISNKNRSSPQASPQQQDKDNNLQSTESLDKILVDSKQSILVKQKELDQHQKVSQKELEDVQSFNTNFNQNLISLKKENEELLRQLRIKTYKIIEPPSKVQNELLEEDEEKEDSSQNNKALNSHIEGFEFSSMRDDIPSKEKQYTNQSQGNENNERRSQLSGAQSDLPLDQEGNIRQNSNRVTTSQIQSKRVGTSDKGIEGGGNDGLFEEAPVKSRIGSMDKLLNSLTMNDQSKRFAGQRQTIQEDQKEQFNQKQLLIQKNLQEKKRQEQEREMKLDQEKQRFLSQQKQIQQSQDSDEEIDQLRYQRLLEEQKQIQMESLEKFIEKQDGTKQLQLGQEIDVLEKSQRIQDDSLFQSSQSQEQYKQQQQSQKQQQLSNANDKQIKKNDKNQAQTNHQRGEQLKNNLKSQQIEIKRISSEEDIDSAIIHNNNNNRKQQLPKESEISEMQKKSQLSQNQMNQKPPSQLNQSQNQTQQKQNFNNNLILNNQSKNEGKSFISQSNGNNNNLNNNNNNKNFPIIPPNLSQEKKKMVQNDDSDEYPEREQQQKMKSSQKINSQNLINNQEQNNLPIDTVPPNKVNKQILANNPENQRRQSPGLSADQWKQISQQLKVDHNQNVAYTINSLVTEQNQIGQAEQLPMNNSEEQEGDQQQSWEFQNSNPLITIQAILSKFQYQEQKKTVEKLISQNKIKQFPNSPLQNKELNENNFNPDIRKFLQQIIEFDFDQFKGQIQQQRRHKSVNLQKTIISDVKNSDKNLGEKFQLNLFLSNDDFTRSSEDHFSCQNISGSLTYLVQHEPYISTLKLNRMLMPELTLAQFKINNQCALAQQSNENIKLLIGVTVESKQQVTITKQRFQCIEDVLMVQQDLQLMQLCQNSPFILCPLASIITSEGTNWYQYKAYIPLEETLNNYILKNKQTYKQRLMLALQIIMGVFAFQQTHHTIGGQIDPFSIFIFNQKTIKMISALSNHSQTFESPERHYNRNLEYRSDVFALGILIYSLFSNISFKDILAQLNRPDEIRDPNRVELNDVNKSQRIKSNVDQSNFSSSPKVNQSNNINNSSRINSSQQQKSQQINASQQQQKSILKKQTTSQIQQQQEQAFFFKKTDNYTQTWSSYLEDKSLPHAISQVLAYCLTENYRDRISCAGLCLYFQHLLFLEDPIALDQIIKPPLEQLGQADALFQQQFKLLPFENKQFIPNKKQLLYLENGCYFGSLDKSGKLSDNSAFIFQQSSVNNSLNVFIGELTNDQYQFGFQFNTKGENVSVYKREGDKCWLLENEKQELIEVKHYKGITLIPNELEKDFIDFLLNKRFKLLDSNGNVMVGNYSVDGLKGVFCRLDLISKTVKLGMDDTVNVIDKDGIEYKRTKVDHFIPDKDFKVKSKTLTETSHILMLGPIDQLQVKQGGSILRFVEDKGVEFKISKFNNNFKIEYIVMTELIVICLEAKPIHQQQQYFKIVVVIDIQTRLHSFLPASSTAVISDLKMKNGYLGIATDIDKEGIYIGHFNSCARPIARNDMKMNFGYYFSCVGKCRPIENFIITSIVKNITLF